MIKKINKENLKSPSLFIALMRELCSRNNQIALIGACSYVQKKGSMPITILDLPVLFYSEAGSVQPSFHCYLHWPALPFPFIYSGFQANTNSHVSAYLGSCVIPMPNHSFPLFCSGIQVCKWPLGRLSMGKGFCSAALLLCPLFAYTLWDGICFLSW